MSRINLNSSERVLFGEFLKDVAQLLCDKKVYDMRSGVTIEQSSHTATRVRIEFSYYLTPETQTLLEKLAIQYQELIQ